MLRSVEIHALTQQSKRLPDSIDDILRLCAHRPGLFEVFVNTDIATGQSSGKQRHFLRMLMARHDAFLNPGRQPVNTDRRS